MQVAHAVDAVAVAQVQAVAGIAVALLHIAFALKTAVGQKILRKAAFLEPFVAVVAQQTAVETVEFAGLVVVVESTRRRPNDARLRLAKIDGQIARAAQLDAATLHYRTQTPIKREVVLHVKAHLVDVVAHAQGCKLVLLAEAESLGLAFKALVGASGQARFAHPGRFFIVFEHEVDGFFAAAIVHACEFGFFRFLVVHLHLFDGIGGQVARGHLGIVAKKLLAIYQHPLHVFAHGFYVAGPVDFHAGQFFQQLFYWRIFAGFKGTGIVFNGIAVEADGNALIAYLHPTELIGFGLEQQQQGRLGIGRQLDAAVQGFVAQKRSLQQVRAWLGVFDEESACRIGDGEKTQGAVGHIEQGHRAKGQGFAFGIAHFALQGHLSPAVETA